MDLYKPAKFCIAPFIHLKVGYSIVAVGSMFLPHGNIWILTHKYDLSL